MNVEQQREGNLYMRKNASLNRRQKQGKSRNFLNGKQMIERINKTKSWLFVKTSHSKPTVRLVRREGVNNFGNERESVITTIAENCLSITDCYEHLHAVHMKRAIS